MKLFSLVIGIFLFTGCGLNRHVINAESSTWHMVDTKTYQDIQLSENEFTYFTIDHLNDKLYMRNSDKYNPLVYTITNMESTRRVNYYHIKNDSTPFGYYFFLKRVKFTNKYLGILEKDDENSIIFEMKLNK